MYPCRECGWEHRNSQATAKPTPSRRQLVKPAKPTPVVDHASVRNALKAIEQVKQAKIARANAAAENHKKELVATELFERFGVCACAVSCAWCGWYALGLLLGRVSHIWTLCCESVCWLIHLTPSS